MPLSVDFTSQAAQAGEGPFRQIQPRILTTPASTSFVSMHGDVAVPTVGGGWGATKISAIESLLVWSVLFPEGAQKGDVTLDPGTCLYFSVRVWKRDEVERLTPSLHEQERELESELSTEQTLQGGPLALRERIDARKALEGRVDRLRRGLPPRDAPTMELAPGPGLSPPASNWSPSGLLVAQQGQVSVRRAVNGLRPTKNPFDLIRPNSFGQSEEWGVVGSFEMSNDA